MDFSPLNFPNHLLKPFILQHLHQNSKLYSLMPDCIKKYFHLFV